MDDTDAVLAAIRQEAEDDRAHFLDVFARDISAWKLEPDERAFLRRITKARISGRALLSNTPVRRSAQLALMDALTAEYEQHPDRHWLWITLTPDTGLTWERAPKIDAVTLRNMLGQHLRRCGLHGFGVLETDIWKNLTGERRRCVPHVHFVGFPADGEEIDVAALEAELCGRRALVNSLGARPADVQELVRTTADFARIGRYMFKPPGYAKNRVPKANGNGFELQQVEHARGSAARLVEILSHMEVGDAMFSIGAGKAIARAVRNAVANEVRERTAATAAPTQAEVERYWQEIRRTSGSKSFQPCVIVTRKDQRVP